MSGVVWVEEGGADMFVVIAENADGFGERGSVDAVGCPADDGDDVCFFGAD